MSRPRSTDASSFTSLQAPPYGLEDPAEHLRYDSTEVAKGYNEKEVVKAEHEAHDGAHDSSKSETQLEPQTEPKHEDHLKAQQEAQPQAPNQGQQEAVDGSCPDASDEFITASPLLSQQATFQSHNASSISSMRATNLLPSSESPHLSSWGRRSLQVIILAIFALYFLPTATESTSSSQPHLDQIDKSLPIFAILGKTGVGKSSFIHTLGGHNVNTKRPPVIGYGLASCTNDTEFYIADGPHGPVYLIDTAGIDGNDMARNDSEIMNSIFTQLNILHDGDKLLMGLLFMYDIRSDRIEGSIINSLEMIEHLCGKGGISKVALVTTRWDSNINSAQYKREAELRQKYWKRPLDCGSSLVQYRGTKESALDIISHLSNQRRLVLPAEGGSFCKLYDDDPVQIPSHEPKPRPISPGQIGSVLPDGAWRAVVASFLVLLKCLYIFLAQGLVQLGLLGIHVYLKADDPSPIFWVILEGVLLLGTMLLCPGWLCMNTQCMSDDAFPYPSWVPFLNMAPIWTFRMSSGAILVLVTGYGLSGDDELHNSGLILSGGSLATFQLAFMWDFEWIRGWWHGFDPSDKSVLSCVVIYLGFSAYNLLKERGKTQWSDGEIFVAKICTTVITVLTWWKFYG